ncbi:MAG: fused MFS/spermidine synthase [Planctomycetes bacterium]|nr:fused MFS/spermidine synthase [Planctomycetota bacterium]
MIQNTDQPSENRAPTPRLLPILVVLFVGSGCSALIYEIVWLQMLQLVIGSTAVSMGVLLGTFMGGMCLGSLALPWLVSARSHPLRVYSLIEFGIGILGLVLLFAMPVASQIYIGSGSHGASGILLRGLLGALCLLPPTFLMGATLPAIARWLQATPQGVSWLGFFYAGNIAGAVFGCLLAGFYLLRVHDMAVATYVAVGINLIVAGVGFWLAALVPYAKPVAETAAAPAQPAGLAPSDEATSASPPELPSSLSREEVSAAAAQPVAAAVSNEAIYVAIALSGATALGAEVVWTRLLSLMLGTTVYTFAIILAVFLIGLGIGSSVGARLARQSARPRLALGVCQLMLTAAIAWAAFSLAHSLPYWPIDSSLVTSPWDVFPLDLMRCLWVTLPATILWGASFPLALAAVASRDQDTGRLVGRVYAANTVGAIVGAVGTSVFLIGEIGTQHSQRLMIALSTLAALVALAPMLWRSEAIRFPALLARRSLLVASMALAVFMVWSVDPVPPRLIAFGGVTFNGMLVDSNILYVGEGTNSSVAVLESTEGARMFHVSGRPEAGNDLVNMRNQRMLGHFPALLHAKPKSVLIVGCGAGVTAGSFVVHPDIERIVICEIEPLVPQAVAPFFKNENYDVVNDPRVEIIYDDARHFILTTREKFDVITTDPIHPWVKGSAALYTQEYYELLKRRLNPGGVVAQWVPIGNCSQNTVKSQMATFFKAFPEGLVWFNDHDEIVVDVVVTGQVGPARIDLDGLKRRLLREDHAEVADSLADVGLDSATDILATYGGRAPELAPWLADAEINRDRNLRLQYLAGLGQGSVESLHFRDDLIAIRTFPDDLFVGTDQERLTLKEAIEEVTGLTQDEKDVFEITLAEIDQFGEDRHAKALAEEVQDIYLNGNNKEKIAWLRQYALPAITREEQDTFDAFVKELTTKKEQDDARQAWEETSIAGKRYYLVYLASDWAPT